MTTSRLLRLFASFLIVLMLGCSYAAVGQRRRPRKRSARTRQTSQRPAANTPDKQTASADLQLNQDAARQIKDWMEMHFTEYGGKRYFVLRKVEDTTTDPLDRRRKEVAVEQAARLGMATSFLQFTELTGLTWTINREQIAAPRPADIANGEIADEWRGTVYFSSDKSPMSRDFQQCGWTKYRDGLRDQRGNSLSPVTLIKTQGEWHFSDTLYESVSLGDVAGALSEPTMTTEELGQALSHYILKRRCQ